MDLTYLLIGFGLGVLGRFLIKEVFQLFQIFFCIGSSYLFVKIIHPDIILRPPSEWSFYNLFSGYNFWLLAIVGALVSWFIFYFLIPKIATHFLVDKIENKYNKIYAKLSQVEMNNTKQVIYRFLKSWLKFHYATTWKKPTQIKINESQLPQYQYYINSIILTFCISIHIIVNWFTYFSFNLYVLIPIFSILILISIVLFALPIIKNFVDDISKLAIYEYNRNIEQS